MAVIRCSLLPIIISGELNFLLLLLENGGKGRGEATEAEATFCERKNKKQKWREREYHVCTSHSISPHQVSHITKEAVVIGYLTKCAAGKS